MPWVYMPQRRRPGTTTSSDVAALWVQVARRRRLDGDFEGAARAMRAVEMGRSLVNARRPNTHVGLGCVHLLAWTGHFGQTTKGIACGYARPGSGMSESTDEVTCGNCTRTKVYKKLRYF